MLQSLGLATLVFLSAQWVTYKSVEGRFQIEAPATLSPRIQQISTAVGLVEYYTYFYDAQSDSTGSFLYLVSTCVYPEGAFHSDSLALLEDFFMATIEQSAISVSGEVVFTDQIRYDNYPGRFWRTHYNGGRTVMKTKCYLVNDRFYSVQVAVDAAYSLHPDIDRFFDSFRIISEP
jgi:hypothetical protein